MSLCGRLQKCSPAVAVRTAQAVCSGWDETCKHQQNAHWLVQRGQGLFCYHESSQILFVSENVNSLIRPRSERRCSTLSVLSTPQTSTTRRVPCFQSWVFGRFCTCYCTRNFWVESWFIQLACAKLPARLFLIPLDADLFSFLYPVHYSGHLLDLGGQEPMKKASGSAETQIRWG